MATGAEVLRMLCPAGGWVISGDTYEGITFIECQPITEKQFQAGFAQYDAWKSDKEAQAATDKAALLARMGLTADELQTLLS